MKSIRIVMAERRKWDIIMSLKIIFALLITILVLVGCVSQSYKVKFIEPQFSEDFKSTPSLAVAKFDAITPSRAIRAGHVFFGLVGALIASAATSGNVEVLGINLQNETMNKLQEELSKVKVKYKSIDLMEGTNEEEVSKRFKSNRGWGFKSLEKEEIEDFFLKNPDVHFGIHIKSDVRDVSPQLLVFTSWIIYDKNGLSVAEIETKSVGELSEERLSEENYFFNEVKKLQYKNIGEFIRLIGTM